MARCPLPSIFAFGLLESHGAVFDEGSQYNSSSLFPNPLLPVSKVHLVESMALFAAPLNSSHHCGVQVTAPVVMVGTPEHWALESRVEEIANRSVNSSNVAFIPEKVLQSCPAVNKQSIF